MAGLSLLTGDGSFGASVLFDPTSTLNSPLSSSPDGSGASLGLTVGIPISAVAVLTSGIVIAVFFVRKVEMKDEGDESDQPDRSTLHIDFADDMTDETTVTPYVTTVTDEREFRIPSSLPNGFASDVTASLLH
jgi:hypothetical protein